MTQFVLFRRRIGHDPIRAFGLALSCRTLRSYHVSLSRGTVGEAAWQRLCERWDGAEVVLAIDYITVNGVAVLSWAGLGADADAWALYEQGEVGHKWRDNRFGLHMSM